MQAAVAERRALSWWLSRWELGTRPVADYPFSLSSLSFPFISHVHAACFFVGHRPFFLNRCFPTPALSERRVTHGSAGRYCCSSRRLNHRPPPPGPERRGLGRTAHRSPWNTGAMSADPDGEKVQVHGQQHQHHRPDDVERPPSVTTETTSTAHEGPEPGDDENDEDDDYATERDLEKADHIVSATFPGEAAGGGTTVRAGSPGLDHHHHHHRSGPGSAPDPDLEEKTVGDDAVVARRSPSRASSARSRPLTIVPRHRRRGLFGRFTIVPEVKRPYDYKNSTKWGLTATVAFATIAAPLGSSIFYREPAPASPFPLSLPHDTVIYHHSCCPLLHSFFGLLLLMCM